jgi:hypothetical protein
LNKEGVLETKEKLREEFEAVWPEIGKLFPEDLGRKIKDLATTKLLKSNATKRITDKWVKKTIMKSLDEAVPIIYYKADITIGFPEMKALSQKIDSILNPNKPRLK